MANYVYNRIVAPKSFIMKYIYDTNPFGEDFAKRFLENNKENNWYSISFNKLYGCNDIDMYHEITKCTTIDYGSGFEINDLEDGMCEVLFDTRWNYPIMAIIKACELSTGSLTWYAIEENEIYFSEFKMINNEIIEKTLFIEDVEDYVNWSNTLWDEVHAQETFVYPSFWIWGYKPETKNWWKVWPCNDLVGKYLNDYPAGLYYREMRKED